HFQAIDRCTPNAVLMVSSTGTKRGRFFDAFTSLRDQWHCVRVSLEDCPHIDKDKINSVISTWGIDHPFTRSTLFGEFMEHAEIEKYVVSEQAISFALQNPPIHKPGYKAAFCDFADGGAENVVALRDGNKITLE